MNPVPFISWIGHGAASLAPPGVFTGVKGYSFAIKADTGAMQQLTDTLLNPAAGDAVVYKALFPAALFTFMDIARCTSGVDQVGWLPGRECAIWVPLAEWHHREPWRSRLVFWAPYIFIDYTIGMLTGREVWGWPKVHAQIDMMGDTPGVPAFACTTTFFRELTAEQPGERGVLYRIVPRQTSAAAEPAWVHGAEAAGSLIARLFGDAAEHLAELVTAIGLRPDLPSVVTKAVSRCSGCQSMRAFGQSWILRCGSRGSWRRGILQHRYEVEITTCASHRIVQDLLGIQPSGPTTILPVEWAAWVDMDMQALPGKDVVRAG